MTTNTTIRYIDAPAGSGKSEVYIHEALRLAQSGENVLLIFPTINLISEMKQRLDTAKSALTFVTVVAGGSKPATRLKDAMDHPLGEGQIVLATHAAFTGLPFLEHFTGWHVLIDEVLEIYDPSDMNVAKTHWLITDHLETKAPFGDYSVVGTRHYSRQAIDKLVTNKDDDEIYAKFRSIASRFRNRKWVNYVSKASYSELIAGKGVCKRLTIFSVLSPDFLKHFKSVTVASALFTKTLMYLLWSRMGVRFVEADDLLERLRYRTHENGSLIKIAWLTEQPWSKNLRDKPGVTDAVVEAVEPFVQGKPYVWSRNLADAGSRLIDDGEISVKSHGCNKHQHANQSVALFSCNLKPEYSKFLQSYGISQDELTVATHRSAIYQFIMRISIRDPLNTEPKLIVVPSLFDAEWLSTLFPESSLFQIPNSIDVFCPKKPRGKKRIHASNAHKTASYRIKKRTEDFMSSHAPLLPIDKQGCMQIRCDDEAIDSYRINVTLSLYKERTSKVPYLQFSNRLDTSLEEILLMCHSNEIDDKYTNLLATTTLFDEYLSSETSRGLDNVLSVTGIWLDYDEGHLTPMAFASAFDELRMVIYNTWSSRPDNNKWRAFIPTISPMTAKEYEAVVRAIVQITKEMTHCDGFDTSKFNATSLFYVPCQANHPEGSFFHDLRDGRGILDPQAFLRAISWDEEPLVYSIPTTRPDHIDERAVEEAIRFWQSACLTKGVGNYEFLRLACRLAKAGVDEAGIRRTLNAQAAFAQSSKERQKGIAGVINSVKRYGHL